MKYSSSLLNEAVEALSELPSIGKKSALRLTLHLLNDESNLALRIAQKIVDLKNNIKKCEVCYNYSDHKVCQICSDPSRNKNIICVVESIRDVMAIEDTDQFSGVYHVLGGIISPIEGIGPSELNIDGLIRRVEKDAPKELIMAVSPTIDGETTIFYITKMLKNLDVKVSTIARGVSFGGELEYADELTLGRSIHTRIPYSTDSNI
ncbi:recombination mediator RecR [Portibacter lacus]|uniref:Recombination protein RecR n=1 Tax=Portibacter lacus TaxID=1099794 RepID=A0AA37WG46_9BACT|nr:recombination mediator RecR [Portibacter lacus]GLR19362.1 recombination protein RecR [Portibacter lacus]